MIKFVISEDFKKRYLSFLSSDLFKNQTNISKTDYWDFYSKKFNYSLKGNILEVKGESGFYFSDNNFLINIKKSIKKFYDFFDFTKPRYLSYKEAFKKSIKKNLDYSRIIHPEKCFIQNFGEIKKKYPFKNLTIDEHTIRSYYYINLINNYLNLSNLNSILEIGPGSCNLTSLLKAHFNIKNFILIDLPETLTSTIPIINNLFPDSKILFPHENFDKIDQSLIEKYDFIFLTPGQLNTVSENIVDLSINTDSFQEMNLEQVNLYLDLIQRASKKNSYFFIKNRIEKIPFSNQENIRKLNIKPTKFSDYKFYKNEIKFFEICDFSLDVQKYPMFIRLEKILK